MASLMPSNWLADAGLFRSHAEGSCTNFVEFSLIDVRLKRHDLIGRHRCRRAGHRHRGSAHSWHPAAEAP